MAVAEWAFWCSLFVILYTYFGYPLIIILAAKLRRRHARSSSHGIVSDAELPTVNVIFAAHNEAPYIARKLENCQRLDYPAEKLRILVGSDGSTDGTNEIAASIKSDRIEFVAFNPRSGKMATVNRLVRMADGDVCVFTDVSELFDPDAIRRLVVHFDDPKVGLVAGNHIYNSKSSGIGVGTRIYRQFLENLDRAETKVCSVFTCHGPIYACRRALYPFPPDNTINDDVAVPWSILSQGHRMVFEPAAVVRGDVLPATNKFFRQKVRCQAGKYQNFSQFPRLFIPWPPLRWWIFVSRCVLPTVVPWMLLVALFTNVALLFAAKPLYLALFVVQAAFYLASVIGLAAEVVNIRTRALSLPFYFVTANVGSMFGFISFLLRIQRAAWRRVE